MVTECHGILSPLSKTECTGASALSVLVRMHGTGHHLQNQHIWHQSPWWQKQIACAPVHHWQKQNAWHQSPLTKTVVHWCQSPFCFTSHMVTPVTIALKLFLPVVTGHHWQKLFLSMVTGVTIWLVLQNAWHWSPFAKPAYLTPVTICSDQHDMHSVLVNGDWMPWHSVTIVKNRMHWCQCILFAKPAYMTPVTID